MSTHKQSPPRGYGSLWGSDYNKHSFYPTRFEGLTGSVNGAETVVSGLHPETREGIERTAVPDGMMVLSGKGASVTLDYGVNVAGVPFLEVSSCTDGATVQIVMCETVRYLQRPQGDGPISFYNGPGTYRNPILRLAPGTNWIAETHGGQRWERITLISEGVATITRVGFVATISSLHPSKLPGFFECSNTSYNDIWDASVRTLQLCTTEERCTPPLWEITPLGARIQSQVSSRYIRAREEKWTRYKMEFQVTIERANCGWAVGIVGLGGYVFYLHKAGYLRAGEPESSRLARDSISVIYGYVDEDNISVESKYLDVHPLEDEIPIGQAFLIETRIRQDGIDIQLDGRQVYTLPAEKLVYSDWAKSSTPTGSFGLCPGPDGLAVYTNLQITAESGETLYASKLDNVQALDDFAVGTTVAKTLLDGGKRDRLLFGGDAAMMGPPLAYSTYDLEAQKNCIETLTEYQLPNGSFAQSGSPLYKVAAGELMPSLYYGGIPYEMYMIQSIHDAWLLGAMTTAAVQSLWPKLIAQVERFLQFLDDKHLVFIPTETPGEGVDFNYYDPSRTGYTTKTCAQLVLTLRQMKVLGNAIGRSIPSEYDAHIAGITEGINEHLWNDEKKAYSHTSEWREMISQDGNTFALLAEVAPPERVPRIFDAIKKHLQTPLGPLVVEKNPAFRESISPFMCGWHLWAAAKYGNDEHVKLLLDHVFGRMANPEDPDYVGTMWELYMSDGAPGMGPYTSLAHAWGSAPAAVLPYYVVGVQPLSPAFETFLIRPTTLDLEFASARIPTPNGLIKCRWSNSLGNFTITADLPEGCNGHIQLPYKGHVRVNGEQNLEELIEVVGGSHTTVVVTRA